MITSIFSPATFFSRKRKQTKAERRAHKVLLTQFILFTVFLFLIFIINKKILTYIAGVSNDHLHCRMLCHFVVSILCDGSLLRSFSKKIETVHLRHIAISCAFRQQSTVSARENAFPQSSTLSHTTCVTWTAGLRCFGVNHTDAFQKSVTRTNSKRLRAAKTSVKK